MNRLVLVSLAIGASTLPTVLGLPTMDFTTVAKRVNDPPPPRPIPYAVPPLPPVIGRPPGGIVPLGRPGQSYPVALPPLPAVVAPPVPVSPAPALVGPGPGFGQPATPGPLSPAPAPARGPGFTPGTPALPFKGNPLGPSFELDLSGPVGVSLKPQKKNRREPEPMFEEGMSELDARDFDEMDMELDMRDVYYGYDVDELD
jgi:hypothetical protein